MELDEILREKCLQARARCHLTQQDKLIMAVLDWPRVFLDTNLAV